MGVAFLSRGIVPLPERTYQLLGSNQHLTACMTARTETSKCRFGEQQLMAELIHFDTGPRVVEL